MTNKVDTSLWDIEAKQHSKRVYFNKPQLLTQYIGAKTTVIVAGRRTGKTDSIASPFVLRNMQRMPGSTGGIVVPTFKHGLTNMLPGLLAAWKRWGYINGVHYVDGGLFHNFPVSIIREECERIIGVNVSPLIPQKYKQTIFHIAERSYHYMFRANTLEDREMCDVLIEAEEFGLYKTFDLENVDVICNIGYSAAARCFEKVLDENKYETLVKAIAARKKGLMP